MDTPVYTGALLLSCVMWETGRGYFVLTEGSGDWQASRLSGKARPQGVQGLEALGDSRAWLASNVRGLDAEAASPNGSLLSSRWVIR